MAYVTKNDQQQYIEIGNYVVDFSEGDVLMLNDVHDLTPVFPLKSSTRIVAICNKGWQKLLCNGQEMTLNEGSILLCPSKLRVAVLEHSNDFNCHVLSYTDMIISGLLRDKIDIWRNESHLNTINIISLPAMFREDFDIYLSLIQRKLKPHHHAFPYEILLALLRALFLEIHYLLVSDSNVVHEKKPSQGKILFNRFLSLISSSKVKRQPITYYAGQLAITPKYLTMLCLKFSNKTASEWVAQYTVEEIRFFLKHTELSIKEISAQMGFSNMSHFGSYVRKHLGMSPSEYRYTKR